MNGKFWTRLVSVSGTLPRIWYVQGSANPRTPGLVNFVYAVAYHFCLNLPRAFSQPGARGLADPCRLTRRMVVTGFARPLIPDRSGGRGGCVCAGRRAEGAQKMRSPMPGHNNRGGRDPLKPLKPLELRSFGGGPSSPL